MTLFVTAEVKGVVMVPASFDPSDVTIRLMSMRDIYSVTGTEVSAGSWNRHRRFYRDLWPHIFETRPDPEGYFAFENLPSNTMIYLAAESPNLGQTQFMGDKPQRLRSIEFNMEPECVIEGTLTYKETDEPAVGITVLALA